jgi:hypothetical protein
MKKLIWISLLFFVSCRAPQKNDDRVFITIDGHRVEMVADEFGNQYLKQQTYWNMYIYVPFPFETEEVGDTLHSYEAKIKPHGTRRL